MRQRGAGGLEQEIGGGWSRCAAGRAGGGGGGGMEAPRGLDIMRGGGGGVGGELAGKEGLRGRERGAIAPAGVSS